MKAAYPNIRHFIIQRQELPKNHELHLCIDLKCGDVLWITVAFKPSVGLLLKLGSLLSE